MTEERSKQRTDGLSDPAVSRAYRDIATERTPASLNESILQHAARRTGHGYPHSIAWLRPLAWAATIGLCLAIVLELAELPQAVPVDAIPSLRERPARVPEVSAGAEPVDVLATPPAAEDNRLREAFDASPRRDQVLERRQRATESDAVPAERKAGNIAGAFDVTEAPTLEEAAAAARLRGGPDERAGDGAGDTSANAFAVPVTRAESCTPEAQARPETWLDCIRQLREAGREAEADEQQRQLVVAFPDFDLP